MPKKKKETAKTPVMDDENKKSVNTHEQEKFVVVGIGASAGGLEAIEQFFRNLPQKVGAAFVIIQHLGPHSPSMLAELISRFTNLKAHEAINDVHIEPDHIYVIPPNTQIEIIDGALKVTEPPRKFGSRMPIDAFFRSLAEERADKAVGIILSGTGTDGTLGIKAINGSGGITMVQDLRDAKFQGMPESAINSGYADYILPAGDMGQKLKDLVLNVAAGKETKMDIVPEKLENVTDRILRMVGRQTGHDFTLYKKSTILRRIQRRMSLHNFIEPTSYLKYLEGHTDEVKLLFKELLIRVTNFFRDPQAFDALQRQVLPMLLADKPDRYVFRVWVVGCSTGEEAYSIMIALREYAQEKNKAFSVQMFATDIDAQAIDQARAGLYPPNIAADVSEDRLRRYFIQEDRGYRVKKEIRDDVVFAVQDVIKDAPFTKMDLVSCRNLLIYLQQELQNRLIPLFHYSLKPGGVLFLGSSETTGPFSHIYNTIEAKWKFYTANPMAGHGTLDEVLSWTGKQQRQKDYQKALERQPEIRVADVARRELLERFAPASVVIDEKASIIYVHGQTGKYLEMTAGEPRFNLLDMARPGLRSSLASAISDARNKQTEMTIPGVRVKTNGNVHQPVTLQVRPLTGHAKGLLLVSFTDATMEKTGAPEPKVTTEISISHDQGLEEELRFTKENLQATIEELQSSNEELKSTNEELQSTNEELQSTNEELQTSKEELQSTNEELITVNAELQSKISQLSRAEIDMKNLLDAMNIGTIFVDNDLHVQRFTEEVKKLINFIPTDINRFLGDIVKKFKYDNFIEDIRSVIRDLQYKQADIRTLDGTVYHVRIMPYKNENNQVKGAVIIFIDVSFICALNPA